MKRILIVILIVCFALPFAGCGKKAEELQVPANFYYLRQEFQYGVEDGVISSEAREAVHIKDNLTALLTEYLKGPKENHLIRCVPASVSVIAVKTEDRTISLTLSPEFARLSGVDLTLACACLSMTVLDYTDADVVEIMVEDELLGDSEQIRMNREDLLLLDNQNTTEPTT